ncbi:glutathione S-transferase [Klebsiella michiganensis]|uniref:Glutathione S-transferase n=1 Tax=Klebsiella michiganensis TaxID=1134687 RepID=A0A7H4MUN1_9ENTR|nr:glutathione S-transferase [Klebsiella michiganensis]
MATKSRYSSKKRSWRIASSGWISARGTVSSAVSRDLTQQQDPAIVDHAPADGGGPLSLFESGAILLYLAEKTGKLLSGELRERHVTLQWLFWQVGGLGPMLGQNHHFNHFAPQAVPYAIERYQVETQRLYGVLNRRLGESPWLGGNHYSIADIACWPWGECPPAPAYRPCQFPGGA